MGRSLPTGPAGGSYHSIVFAGQRQAASLTNDYRWVAPFSGIIQETSVITDVTTGAPTYAVVNDTQSVNIVASRALPASNVVETLTPTTSPVLANRSFDKGDIIRFTPTTAGAEVADTACLTFTVRDTGFVVASADDD